MQTEVCKGRAGCRLGSGLLCFLRRTASKCTSVRPGQARPGHCGCLWVRDGREDIAHVLLAVVCNHMPTTPHSTNKSLAKTGNPPVCVSQQTVSPEDRNCIGSTAGHTEIQGRYWLTGKPAGIPRGPSAETPLSRHDSQEIPTDWGWSMLEWPGQCLARARGKPRELFPR